MDRFFCIEVPRGGGATPDDPGGAFPSLEKKISLLHASANTIVVV